MEKVKTATGKTFDCDYFNPSNQTKQCNIRIIGQPLPTLATVFGDPEETAKMTCADAAASGFTRLIAIVPEDGATRIVLGKE